MGITKFVDFDLFMNRVRTHGKDHMLQHFAQNVAPLCALDTGLVYELCQKRMFDGGMSAEDGVAIFDLTSRFIEKPVMVLATLENGIAFDASDNKAVDVFVGVFSSGNISAHLQRLSTVARLFRSKDLSKALRETRSIDEMKVLFMPTQDWMIAA
ncbi:MAG: PTS sugar transporter subunit IIA [Alphaproteobacteria bacterium]|nr:PTS sugar transporter subunit IIA [Alphaproteobacteria bacterium]